MPAMCVVLCGSPDQDHNQQPSQERGEPDVQTGVAPVVPRAATVGLFGSSTRTTITLRLVPRPDRSRG
jgi:hypothetical protein